MVVKGSLVPAYTNPVIEKMCQQPFSLMIDESNDRNRTKHLVILARIFEDVCVKTRILDLPELASGKASAIFEAVDSFMSENDIPWANMVGFASENCNTMIGRKDSVLTRLQAKSPKIFSIGCICHLANLCVKDGVKVLPFKVDDLLVDVFYFFHHSSKRIQDFKEFQQFTEVEEQQILKHCPTHWLSLEKVCNHLLSQLPALRSYFASHKDVEKPGKVKSINERLQEPLTELILLFLQYIMPVLKQFNILFQGEDCMVGSLLPKMYRLLWKFSVKFLELKHVKSCRNLRELDVGNQ
ncbi:uncharacterized protein LOC132883380 [Neoarius graeffei]|uniref:uncharacterized protein LOC132883380 n=1 Tax=Neoarius graeffei TaxID=443677 RepID=UPI00298C2AE5|nr:uncharacterized protein LOC132883380 [Neoarius graeffei]XP_060772917.1 uncharacterized protein LOC132883380 [Neoarius graeffei]XP_060772919.1 uncharacterized protein LOC132883380 [Neoarius graeffei]XP_060772920.1 uncharacterized protein LOC132883380 [Neoarius graeffei]XP_060772921.1 uncharacterized protein LOC132883380 [Neoarius graeffei]